ncbi:MAG: hypothetical protein RO009_03225 [Pseudorhodoplanes sp.]|jgi:integrase|nr:hypothetical protein [Pseudorhodoplanes sp.]
MARAPYLTRRDGGRYYLQIRLGKVAADLYGRALLRASLRTSNYAEARRRLVDSLGWACELIDAPDLETLGTVLHSRLVAYSGRGAPVTERELAERVAFENQVRSFIVRSQERGYSFCQRFHSFASNWVDFVNQNKTSEECLIRAGQRREYERGRADAGEAIGHGWTHSPLMHQMRSTDGVSVAPHLSELRPINGKQEAMPGPLPAESALRLSQVAKLFYEDKYKLNDDDRARGEYEPLISFVIKLLGDPELSSMTPSDFQKIDDALPEIPNRKGLPTGDRVTLMSRFKFAKANGWDKLERMTVTTIKSYHIALRAFFGWAIDNGYFHGPKPTFKKISPENLTALPRDAFEDDELLALVNLPLFTGCRGTSRMWTKGGYFLQNHIYWGFLILILTGMRAGEVGQLRCADVVTDGEFFFFDLRPFDARAGRVALKDQRKFKTQSSARVVPIHPLLIDLGLLDRVWELQKNKIDRLFPQWQPYKKPTGELRWGQPMTKSWQYVKGLLEITRKDLTLYGTRHLMADLLDNEAVAQRTRNRILGHVGSVPDGYGRKGMLSPEQSAAIAALEPPVIKKMREVLLNAKTKADCGQLTVLKPWLRGLNS